MRVELNPQGVYRIRPNQPGAPNAARPVERANPTRPAHQSGSPLAPARSTKTVPTAPTQQTYHAQSIDMVSRGHDVAELSSINFRAAQQALPAIDRFHAKMQPLVAAKVNQPISFDPPAPNRPMNFYDRAYFRHAANHASINAAAVERESVNFEA